MKKFKIVIWDINTLTRMQFIFDKNGITLRYISDNSKYVGKVDIETALTIIVKSICNSYREVELSISGSRLRIIDNTLAIVLKEYMDYYLETCEELWRDYEF